MPFSVMPMGIPSDVELMFDSMTIGSLFSCVRGTQNLAGFIFPTKFGCNVIFGGVAPETGDGRTGAKKDGVMKAIQWGPTQMNRTYLRRTLACVCADGQYT